MKTKKNIPMAQNTSFDVFWALFPSPPSFRVVIRDMGIASCKIVPKYVVSKSNQMKKEKEKEKYQQPKTRRWTFLGLVSVTSESPCRLSTWLAAVASLSLSCDC
jgi:hypothetical protein